MDNDVFCGICGGTVNRGSLCSRSPRPASCPLDRSEAEPQDDGQNRPTIMDTIKDLLGIQTPRA